MLLRGFLRRCSISTDLSRAVKFRGSGFFADGAPVLANRQVEAGQVMCSFELPPEGEGGAAGRDPGTCRPRGRFRPPGGKAAPPRSASYPELPAGYAGERLCRLGAASGQKPRFRPVNRIDKDTSGLVLAAQNGYAAPLLAQGTWKSSTMPLQRGTSSRPRRHRRPHRAARREHHRAVRHPRRQAQPDGVYHIESRKRFEPRGLRPGNGADPPDTGTLCLSGPPAGRR